MAEDGILALFVKLTAREDGLPLWVNVNQILGMREIEGGTSLLTQNGALQVVESLAVIFSLPPIQCWQVPEAPEAPVDFDEEQAKRGVEDLPKSE